MGIHLNLVRNAIVPENFRAPIALDLYATNEGLFSSAEYDK